MHTLSRGVSGYDAEGAAHRTRASFPFIAPSKPAYWTDPIPRSVRYAGGDPTDIQAVISSIADNSSLGKTLIVLADPDDPKRPLFLITSLRSRFFPRGSWKAYLYRSNSTHSDDYHLIGSLSLYLEPYQIPQQQTWRLLARKLQAREPMPITRRLRKPSGFLIDPTLPTIALLRGEGGEHNRLGLSEVGIPQPRAF